MNRTQRSQHIQSKCWRECIFRSRWKTESICIQTRLCFSFSWSGSGWAKNGWFCSWSGIKK